MSKRSGTQDTTHEISTNPTSSHTDTQESAGRGIESAQQTTQSSSKSRRSFLRGTAVAGISSLGLLSATSGSATAFHEGYNNVINVVDAGADPTGEESITPVLNNIQADNTAFEFPEGEYYMDEQLRHTRYENIGFFGHNATLVPANYHDFNGPQFRMFRLGTSLNPGERLRFEGFDIDQTASETGIRVIGANVTDRLEVRDITINGTHDSGTWGPALFGIVDSDGEGIVEGFRAPDGGIHSDRTPHAAHSWRGPIGIEANRNEGHLEFNDCELGGFPSNGLYVSGGNGKTVVNGGTFRNSCTANIRLGGDNSEINDATVVIDDTPSYSASQRAIRLENGDGITIDGVDISITSPSPTSHALSVMDSCNNLRFENSSIDIRGEQVNHGIVVSGQAGYTEIIDIDIVHETSGGYPIWIRETNNDDRVLTELIHISGRAGAEGGFRDGIRCERDNCRFSTFVVEQPGRDGVDRNAFVVTGDDTEVYRGEFYASQYPYIDQADNNNVRNSIMDSDDGSLEGVRLYSSASNPTVQYNEVRNGIDDLGAYNVRQWHNTDIGASSFLAGAQ